MAKASAAATLASMSASVGAVLMNAASYCDGGQYCPRDSIAPCHLPKRAVSDFTASPKERIGPLVKTGVIVDPTRCTQTSRSAFFASTMRVLVALREICAGYLHAIGEPLGLLAPPEVQEVAFRRRQQSMGPGPPAPPP